MNKVFGIFTCVAGLLLALGFDISSLICDIGALLILFGAFHYVFLRRLPQNFWLTVGAVLFGPIILASLIRSLCNSVWSYLVVTFGSFALAPLILGGLAVSFIAFMYVRSRISPLLGSNDKQNFINERQPVFPPHLEEDNLIWTEPQKELDLPKEPSDED